MKSNVDFCVTGGDHTTRSLGFGPFIDQLVNGLVVHQIFIVDVEDVR